MICDLLRPTLDLVGVGPGCVVGLAAGYLHTCREKNEAYASFSCVIENVVIETHPCKLASDSSIARVTGVGAYTLAKGTGR